MSCGHMKEESRSLNSDWADV